MLRHARHGEVSSPVLHLLPELSQLLLVWLSVIHKRLEFLQGVLTQVVVNFHSQQKTWRRQQVAGSAMWTIVNVYIQTVGGQTKH